MFGKVGFLYGVAQMVTTNFWPEENADGEDAEWLRKNCLVRRITDCLYYEEDEAV